MALRMPEIHFGAILEDLAIWLEEQKGEVRRRDSRLAESEAMIVSHAHKFIFLKTKKTAGTSIELALSTLCGDEDVITPLTEIDEAKRDRRQRRAELAAAWLVGHRPAAFFKRRCFKFTAADYGFYNHMPAARHARF